MAKMPFLKFYPADWLQSAELRIASLAARGLWIELLCHMHQATPRGYLLIRGRSPSNAEIGVLCGVSEAVAEALIYELESLGVCSREEGVIVNRRMVREGHISAVRGDAGSLGGRPSKSKTKAKRKQNCLESEKQNESKSDQSCESKTISKPLASSFFVTEGNNSEAAITLPEVLNVAEFRESWEVFLAHRKAIKKPLKPLAIENQIKILSGWARTYGISEVCKSITATVANQWQGIFEPKNGGSNGAPRNGNGGTREPIHQQIRPAGEDPALDPSVPY